MDHVYNGVDELAKGETALAGSGECVDLIKKYVPGLKNRTTTSWRAGAWVMAAGQTIRKGTAIATFDADGHYPRHHTGQHAALVLRVTPAGIWVVDQWKTKPKISARLIRVPPPHMERNPDGSFSNASNNALAFRVIE